MSDSDEEINEVQRGRKRKRKSSPQKKMNDKAYNPGIVFKKNSEHLRPRSSARTPKPTKWFEEDSLNQTQQFRSCPVKACSEPQPRCCLQASSNCTRNGYTSRWYHMSLGEHFCNDCFDHFYRIQKPGYEEFNEWNTFWYNHSNNIKPSIKLFVSENVLPYWFQCTIPGCGKWREVSMESIPTPSFIRNFKCEIAYKRVQKNHCSIAEETCVSDLAKPNWMEQNAEIPFLKHSPSGPHLTMFYSEGIGHSPGLNNSIIIRPPKYIEPFNETFNGHSFIWIKPDVLNSTEEKNFLPIYQCMYFAIRNLIVALWNLRPYNWITVNEVSQYLICRGLVRIHLLTCAEKIVRFLTRNGTINYGLVSPPLEYSSLLKSLQNNVIVIGAGISGLAAARHLHNHGIKTLILESKSRIGGRIFNMNRLSLGSSIIFGLINNPLTILCHQAKIVLNEIPSEIAFISADGSRISSDTEETMSYQYGGIKNGALEWAKEHNEDDNWFDVIVKNQTEYHEQIRSFSSEETDYFNCLLQLDELEKGLPLKKLTLLSYEEPKSEGPDAELSTDMYSILTQLADGLDINYESTVCSIELVENGAIVKTNTGSSYRASKVILTVPLSILKNKTINFIPSLPSAKTDCINEIGTYNYEKLLLQFPTKFWDPVLNNNKKSFAIVSHEKIPFLLFQDLTDFSDKIPTLQTFLTDSCFDMCKGKSVDELKDICLNTLRKSFSGLEIKVPEPSYFYMTQWYLDSDILASGSFIKVGSHYKLYDTLSEDVDEKIYFAGEATFRKCPNSASGAYLSGLREAVKILNCLSPIT